MIEKFEDRGKIKNFENFFLSEGGAKMCNFFTGSCGHMDSEGPEASAPSGSDGPGREGGVR